MKQQLQELDMKCDANCFSGTIMMPPLPGKSFGYLILCPTCKGTGTSRFACKPVARPTVNDLHVQAAGR